MFDSNTWNHLTLDKQISSDSMRNNVTNEQLVDKSYMFNKYV